MRADDPIEAQIARLTLEEKASMTAGSGLWLSQPVPRAGVPAFKMSDGPNGVRGDSLDRSIRSACYPVGSALGATWNRALLAEIGTALALECRAKDVDVLLGPTINIHRTPLAGRNFECFSEDPFLTGELAVALVRAVQSRGVACCAKHFVCNDSEFERHSISSQVDERTLREIYLAPFERVVKAGGVWSVMAAYNRVNGTHAAEHRRLLQTILREEWGFEGVVISDWGGTRSTVPSLRAGLDLEMPGPARHFGAKALAAVRSGAVDEACLDDLVRRQLVLMQRTGRLERGAARPEQPFERDEDRALIRRAGAEATVLLRNDGVLPLVAPQRIALVGPNAVAPRVLGGGSSTLRPHRVVSPREGLEDAFPDAEITVVRGCVNDRHLPVLTASACRVPGTERPGLHVRFFAHDGFDEAPVHETHPRQGELVWFGRVAPSVGETFGARIETEIVASEAGPHRVSLVHTGRARLAVNGEVRIDQWNDAPRGDGFLGFGSAETIAIVDLGSGERVRVTVDFHTGAAGLISGVRIGFAPPSHADDLDAAAAAAARADVAVVVVGLTGEWESEGHDRADLELPGTQVALIERVAAASPRTVVAVNAGAPIRYGAWVERVGAVLQIGYPGQELGCALADVLTGRADPGGRLPTTLPVRLEDTPAFRFYPGENGVVRYEEGVLVGYRHYDASRVAPRFPFGFGLSYTTFALEHGAVDEGAIVADGSVVVGVDVVNTGERNGQTVVQLYAADRVTRDLVVPAALRGFEKLTLAPGARARVQFRLAAADFAHYDAKRGRWHTPFGRHVVHIGFSSRDLPVALDVEVS